MYKGSITAYLKRYHMGADRAITSRELERVFGIRRLEISHMISTLRREAGIPIGSNSNGYFYASTKDEIEDTVLRMHRQIAGISRTISGLNQVLDGSREEYRFPTNRSER